MNRSRFRCFARTAGVPAGIGALLLVWQSAGPSARAAGAETGPAVRIAVGFDGSCPHDPAGVKEEGPNRFRIFPSWRASEGIEEEALGRSTRLGFQVVNPGPAAAVADLWIDWQYDQAPPKDRPSFSSREEYMSYRDFVVVRFPGSDAWRTVMADVEAAVAHVRLSVPPGTTEVHWHPSYNYTQSEQFVQWLRARPLVQVEKIGQSPQKRNLWLLRITDDSPRDKKNFLIRARVHAYESGGSYAMEGMVRWLLGDEPFAAAARHQYVFYVIPMANPDGVHDGLGRLTAPRGTNLAAIAYQPDEAGRPIKEAVDRIRPAVAIDLHNWQNKHTDGLLGMDPEIRQRFVRYMPDQLAFGKQWEIRDPQPLPQPAPDKELLRHYCLRNFQSTVVTFEFPWFGRTPDDMRATGRNALWAFLRALDPPPANLR